MIDNKTSQNLSKGNVYNPLVKVDIGIIKKVTMLSNEHVYYTVFLENYHQENESAEGIPVFSFGYNTYTYIEKSRVVCLIKDSDFTKVFILGQTYDPNVVRGISIGKPGELNISSDKSGIIGIGKNDNIALVSENSMISISPDKAKISLGNNIDINLNPSQFNVSLNNNESFNIKNGLSTLNASKGFQVFSESGGIYLSSDSFSFTEKTGETPSYLITNSIHRLLGDEYLSLFSVYSFEVGSSKIKGKKNAVDWNVLQGSYGISLGTGDFKVRAASKNGEISLKIGSLVDLASLTMGPTLLGLGPIKFNVLIGTPINGDELTLGNGSFEVTAGSTPITHSSIEVSDSSVILKANAATSTKIDMGPLKIKLITPMLVGKILLDGDVEITGDLIVNGKVYSTSEIFANAVNSEASGIITTGATKLSTHTHPTAVPGPVSPPTPGT